MKRWLLLLTVLFPLLCNAAGAVLQCGNFRLEAIPNSMFKINGEYVTSQKIRELGEHGVVVNMGLMPASDGYNYGFEYVHPDGSNKRWLNVEIIFADMDAPRVIGSFPCHRVK
ncbi:hypothetical protein AB8D53_16310 [Salmonella enterica]